MDNFQNKETENIIKEMDIVSYLIKSSKNGPKNAHWTQKKQQTQ